MDSKSYFLPFRFRPLGDRLLVTSESGKHDFYDLDMPKRFFDGNLFEEEAAALEDQSIYFRQEQRWRMLSLLRSLQVNKVNSDRLSYLILVPTLRCDLSCSYCQVSRAPIDAAGFDWGKEELNMVKSFIESHGSDGMKIEFQGGEPTLRADLLTEIMEFASEIYSNCEFVICSNLTSLDRGVRDLLDRGDVVVSTSIDGPTQTMTSNRTFSDDVSASVLANAKQILRDYGYEKLAALPTITEEQMGNSALLIDYYRDLGFNSIFLRPVNYQGFARKAYKELTNEVDRWNKFYETALQRILEISQEAYFEEFYLADLVRKIFARKQSGFVDYRSPARYAENYCVIDYDGKIYPTDESRMLSRIRQVDLCIGTLKEGLYDEKIRQLNRSAIHHVNEECVHCAYMPYCGIDIVDDLSRYGRFDVRKSETWFCKRHMFLFDFIFEKVANWEVDWLRLFNSWIHKSRNTSDAFEIFQ